METTENFIANSSDRSQLGPVENVWVHVYVLIANSVYGSWTLGNFKSEFAENAQDKTYLGHEPVYIDKGLRLIQDYTFDVSELDSMLAKALLIMSGFLIPSFWLLLSPRYRFDASKLNLMVVQPLSIYNTALASECKAAKIRRVCPASLTGGKTEDSRDPANYFLSPGLHLYDKHEISQAGWGTKKPNMHCFMLHSCSINYDSLVTDPRARTRAVKWLFFSLLLIPFSFGLSIVFVIVSKLLLNYLML